MAEAFFQLPFFFMAIYGLLYKKEWIRIPLIVYGSHVFTTVFPILYTFYETVDHPRMNKLALFGFYCPYLLIPLILTVYMCLNSNLFGDVSKVKFK